MLEGEQLLTLELLNTASPAWVEHEYHQKEQSEIKETPLARFMRGPTVRRECPPRRGSRSASQPAQAAESSKPKRAGCRYRSGAELLRTLGIDTFASPNGQGRMRMLALVRDEDEVRRFLQALGEPTTLPRRAPARGPPYWASRALRIRSGRGAA